MSKTIRNASLDSPAARAKLKPSGKPYWRAIDTGLHLGYRKGLNGGDGSCDVTLARTAYKSRPLPSPMTIRRPMVPAFSTSFRRSATLAKLQRLPRRPEKTAFTVAAAMAAYFERLEHEGSKSLADAKRPDAASYPARARRLPVADLTRDMLSKWLTGMAAKGADGHSGQDAIRANRASANRVLTILRAALNQAFRDGKAASDIPWRTVKPFRGVDAPRLRYFTKDEVTRLINAAQGNFRDLVKAALLPAAAMASWAVCAPATSIGSGTVFVGQSKSGKAAMSSSPTKGAASSRR